MSIEISNIGNDLSLSRDEAARLEQSTRSGLRLSTLSWLFAGVFLFAAAFLLSSNEEGVPSTVATDALPTPIEDIQLGWRVVAENPLGPETFDAAPDQATWKKVVFHAVSESGTAIEIEFLRSSKWLADNDVHVGKSLDLSLSERNLSGVAKVVSISACPPISKGNGPVVTGLFRHRCKQGELVRVTVDADLPPIVGTYNHPFWSETRQEFVRAIDLEPGEKLLCVDESLLTVKSVEPVAGSKPVFNLETHNQHVYAIGAIGMIVHNMHGADDSIDNRKLNVFGDGEAPAFRDVSPDGRNNPLVGGGRPMTQDIPDGAASEILIRNAPVAGRHNPNTLPEIDRLSKPGTRISVSNAADGDEFDQVLDHFGDRVTIITDKIISKPVVDQRILQIRVNSN